ncbi:MAG: tRNA (guanosine(37)-N1)-methyltransferase TrmD [Parachlamydiaceae bacterium]
MRFDILSLFPEYFKGPFDESILKRAKEKGLIEIHLDNIRNFTNNKWRKVDDRPFGGGPGMVLMAEPVVKAIRHYKKPESRVIYLSPQGKKFDAAAAKRLSKESHLILLCGHYEGIDERAIELEVDEEISIGDYVLTNGAIAAIVLVDAISRFIPGVLGNEEASLNDSFEKEGILDCPHYTQPRKFEDLEVPEVLFSGHHEQIDKWRKEQGLIKTRRNRPDLLHE